MKHFNNQSGAALVLVLAIITIMMIFIPLLLYQLNTASVQFNKTEEKVQADNLAEMGVIYFQEYVRSQIDEGIYHLGDIEEKSVDFPNGGFIITIENQEMTKLTFTSSATVGSTTSKLENNEIVFPEE